MQCQTDSSADAGKAGEAGEVGEIDQVAIEASMTVEISMPGLGLSEPVVDELCPMTAYGVDPVQLMDVCVYTADDKPYVLPSTDQEDVAVLAGHANTQPPAVFDDVFGSVKREFNVELGDELRVRTEGWRVRRVAPRNPPVRSRCRRPARTRSSADTPDRASGRRLPDSTSMITVSV